MAYVSPPAARWDVPLLWSAKAAGTPMPSFPYTVGRPTVPGTPTQKKFGPAGELIINSSLMLLLAQNNTHHKLEDALVDTLHQIVTTDDENFDDYDEHSASNYLSLPDFTAFLSYSIGGVISYPDRHEPRFFARWIFRENEQRRIRKTHAQCSDVSTEMTKRTTRRTNWCRPGKQHLPAIGLKIKMESKHEDFEASLKNDLGIQHQLQLTPLMPSSPLTPVPKSVKVGGYNLPRFTNSSIMLKLRLPSCKPVMEETITIKNFPAPVNHGRKPRKEKADIKPKKEVQPPPIATLSRKTRSHTHAKD
ncbi:hypothetical protein C8R43DRAFT_941574 [Mycena crocata]|nr:hypothetical protein C8R43DRAFT_941574 [Mycena crocata]